MKKENMAKQKTLSKMELEHLMELCERYRYLRQNISGIYAKLTYCEKALDSIGHSDPSGREKVLAAYAYTREQANQTKCTLLHNRNILLRCLQESPLLDAQDKNTLMLRIGKGKTIREIAKQSGKSDAAIVKRIKKCGVKICEDPSLSDTFYDCITQFQQIVKEDSTCSR